MTLRNPNLPRQVDHIKALTVMINQSPYVFIVPGEDRLTEGDWKARMDMFIEDPESGIGNGEYDVLYTRALLTQRFSKYLSKAVVEKYTRCLKEPKSAPTTGEQQLNKLKKAFKKG